MHILLSSFVLSRQKGTAVCILVLGELLVSCFTHIHTSLLYETNQQKLPLLFSYFVSSNRTFSDINWSNGAIHPCNNCIIVSLSRRTVRKIRISPWGSYAQTECKCGKGTAMHVILFLPQQESKTEKTSDLKQFFDIHRDEKLWKCWRCSDLWWRGLGKSALNGICPCPWQGMGTGWPLRVLPNQTMWVLYR